MTEKNIAEPSQKRSIEKKKRIIDAAMSLFNERGYYQTVTTDIASAANVSIGIIYRYFKDKKDILLYILQSSFKNLKETLDKKNIEEGNIREFIEEYLRVSKSFHNLSDLLYRELMALAYLDEDIMTFFIEQNNALRNEVSGWFRKYGYLDENEEEKITMILNLIQTYNHDLNRDNNSESDINCYSKELLVNTIIFILNYGK